MLFFYSSYQQLSNDDRKKKLMSETTTLYQEIVDLEDRYFQSKEETKCKTHAKAQYMAFQQILATLHGELNFLIPHKKGAKVLSPDTLLSYMKRLLALLLYYQEHQKNIMSEMPHKNTINTADFIEKSLNALGLIWAFYQSEKNQERLMYPTCMVLSMIASGLIAGVVLGFAAPYLIAGVLAGAAVGFIIALCVQKTIDYQISKGTLTLNEEFLTESKNLWSQKSDTLDIPLNDMVNSSSSLIKSTTDPRYANAIALIAKEMQWFKDSVPGSDNWAAPQLK